MLVWGLGAGAVPTWGCGQGGAGAGAEHGGPLVREPLCVCGLPVALQLQGWDAQDSRTSVLGIGRGQWSCGAEGWFSKEMTPELFL